MFCYNKNLIQNITKKKKNYNYIFYRKNIIYFNNIVSIVLPNEEKY